MDWSLTFHLRGAATYVRNRALEDQGSAGASPYRLVEIVRRVFGILVVFGFPAAVFGASPAVTNVIAAQRAGTKLVDIRYDVFDAEGDSLKVRVEISHNGGRNYSVPAVTFSGDLGKDITPGTNKLIVWNAGADWDGEYSPQMRVKVIASDGKGLPELEWGREVPPGGFLLGQDGGAEGAGPSRHVNIPWSYWLSKYEITLGQYVEYLNMAMVAGEVYRDSGHVYANAGIYDGVNGGAILVLLGPDIQWSLGKFTVVHTNVNLPVQVSWHGAAAFAQHYGYDLPTEAEWEKAARGADYDGPGEHMIYPWGNAILGSHANFLWSGDAFDNRPTPVGYFDGTRAPGTSNMTNYYGLYDVIGNVAEWTRTGQVQIEDYPSTESLTNAIHDLGTTGGRVVRGGSYLDAQTSALLKCHGRANVAMGLLTGYGFRVVRRENISAD